MNDLRDAQDPYLAWSAQQGFAGHGQLRLDPAAPVPVLLELTPAQRNAVAAIPGVHIPPAYGAEAPFITAFVEAPSLPAVAAAVTRLEFCLPVPARPVAAQPWPATNGQANQVVLAVIDRGFAFLHRNFRQADTGQTRLLGLWQQGQGAAGPDWSTPAGLGYGRELGPQAINSLLAAAAPGASAEAATYQRLGYLLDAGGRVLEFAHGTHVADTAAGRVEGQPARSSAKPAQDDAASAAPLIFVDVPGLGDGDACGASSAAFMLDALHYIRQRAGAHARVVVNISLGALAGPHDGRSLAERALDDYLRRDAGMVVCIAAGNAGDAERNPWHARGTLAAGGSAATLRWRLRPDDPTDSFVELWFRGPSAAQPELRLRSPRGGDTGWVSAPTTQALLPGLLSGQTGAALYRRVRGLTPQDAMALVAVGPCAGAAAVAEPGLWQIDVRCTGAGSLGFDAWIQRDEPIWGGQTPVQSWFESVSGPAEVTADGSINSLATGSQPILVGACSRDSDEPTSYTSRARGAGMRDIDIVEVADESAHAVGLVAAGVRSGALARMGGTSVAAPAAARRLLVLLQQARPTPEDLRTVVTNFLPPPPPQRL